MKPFLASVVEKAYLCNAKREYMATKRLKHRYTEAFGILVILLALARCAYDANWNLPLVGKSEEKTEQPESPKSLENAEESRALDNSESPESLEHSESSESSESSENSENADSPENSENLNATEQPATPVVAAASHTRYVPDGGPYHRILSVSSYQECFPDSNDVQLESARRWGVTPVRDRADAELRKDELVFMAASPYYAVAPLHASIPYLVPRAAVLLHDIGQAFFDSLQVKGLPLHHFIVSSVLRSEADVLTLRRVNRNATEHSCHLYGTTFDINYNRYQSVEHPDRELVGGDRLKWVLSEVLDDMRRQGRCYVKYEVRQPCFHITVR